MKTKLLSIGVDAKTKKGEKQGYMTGILYLAPAQEAGGRTLCPFSTPGCRAVCLYSAGKGAMRNVIEARIRKSRWWLSDPVAFKAQLVADIHELIKMAGKQGMTPVVRLNGVTDICWENEGIMQQFPSLTFYDYSKYPAKLRKDLPPNYSLTFSFSEAPHSVEWSKEWQERGVNTAVVFSGKLPPTFLDRPVIDGDLSDLRFLDPAGVIVGLKSKGKARKAEVGEGRFLQRGLAA